MAWTTDDLDATALQRHELMRDAQSQADTRSRSVHWARHPVGRRQMTQKFVRAVRRECRLPVSAIQMCSSLPVPSAPSVMWPHSVNLAALLNRLSTIWASLAGSVSRTGSVCGSSKRQSTSDRLSHMVSFARANVSANAAPRVDTLRKDFERADLRHGEIQHVVDKADQLLAALIDSVQIGQKVGRQTLRRRDWANSRRSGCSRE